MYLRQSVTASAPTDHAPDVLVEVAADLRHPAPNLVDFSRCSGHTVLPVDLRVCRWHAPRAGSHGTRGVPALMPSNRNAKGRAHGVASFAHAAAHVGVWIAVTCAGHCPNRVVDLPAQCSEALVEAGRGLRGVRRCSRASGRADRPGRRAGAPSTGSRRGAGGESVPCARRGATAMRAWAAPARRSRTACSVLRPDGEHLVDRRGESFRGGSPAGQRTAVSRGADALRPVVGGFPVAAEGRGCRPS